MAAEARRKSPAVPKGCVHDKVNVASRRPIELGGTRAIER